MTNDLIKERAKQNICTYSLEAIDIAEAVIYVLETPERVEVSGNKIEENSYKTTYLRVDYRLL